MASPLPLEFLRSASDHDQLPQSVVEVALIGRSNVGKSSLINALAQRKKLARTSKTPGATQLLNVYEHAPAGSGLWLVDLPGYGFAKLSKAQQASMADMIDGYLTQRPWVDGALLLFDANVGPTDRDLETIDWLRSIDLDFELVGTKVDKIKSSQRAKRKRMTLDRLGGIRSGEVHWTSAEKGQGIPELRARLHRLLTGEDTEDTEDTA